MPITKDKLFWTIKKSYIGHGEEDKDIHDLADKIYEMIQKEATAKKATRKTF